MQATGNIGTDTGFKFFFDEEEEVFNLTGIGQLSRIDFLINSFQSDGNLCRLIAIKNAGFNQHHQMGAVDASKPIHMMRLGTVKQRPQHGFFINRIWKHAIVGQFWVEIRHGSTFKTSKHNTAYDVALQQHENDKRRQCGDSCAGHDHFPLDRLFNRKAR
ncbi:hypothetical protein D3C80_863840 [compost metagenome]